jgi:ankyrin repeat protein
MTKSTYAAALKHAMEQVDAEGLKALLNDTVRLKELGDEAGELLRHSLVGCLPQGTHILLDHGVRLTRAQATREHLLPHAAMNLGMCKMLIELDVDVNEQDVGGITALHRAVIYARLDICEYLLSAGASANLFDAQNKTPMHHLTFVGMPTSVELARAFVATGANFSITPHPAPKDYLTPFQVSVRGGQLDVFAYLVDECNEDLDQKTSDGQTLEEIATGPKMRTALLSARTKRDIDLALALI